jgi:uncharacterized protein (DUF2132 family)
MSFIRGGGLFIFSIILFVILIISGLFLTISLSLNYEVVKPELSMVVSDVVESNFDIKNDLDEEYGSLLNYCESHDSFGYDYLDENITVPCYIIEQSLGSTINFVALQHTKVGNDQEAHIKLEADAAENYNDVLDYCKSHNSYLFEDNKSSYDFTFPCETVALGVPSIIEYATSDLVDEIYYKNYDCDFVDCFEATGTPFFLFSLHTKNYFKRKFIFLILGAIACAFLMFLFAERKGTALILTGLALTVSPFFIRVIFNILLSLFTNSLYGFVDLDFSLFITPFFSKLGFVRILYLICGFILLGLGIFFRLWTFSATKKKFSHKDVQKIVKKEISKTKKQ